MLNQDKLLANSVQLSPFVTLICQQFPSAIMACSSQDNHSGKKRRGLPAPKSSAFHHHGFARTGDYSVAATQRQDTVQQSHSFTSLIAALQTGGSRSKMEAAISVRMLAGPQQDAFLSRGGIRPLVDMLTYEASELHWPPEMRQKATITVRAEASLALASLAVSSDEHKAAIGDAGAIRSLCRLLQCRDSEQDYTGSLKKQEMQPFFILARDAAAGALSCLAKDRFNKIAIMKAQAVPTLVQILEMGTPFGRFLELHLTMYSLDTFPGRAAAANILAKLATGDSGSFKLAIGRNGAIPALIKLLQNGSCKAREAAAEALANLALISDNKALILKEGGLNCLLRMQAEGSQREKETSALAMCILSSDLLWPTQGAQVLGIKMRKQITKRLANDHANENAVALPQEAKSKLMCQGYSNNHQNQGNEPYSNRMKSIVTSYKSFSSELTSSLAPPLSGQASIQAKSQLFAVAGSNCQTGIRKRIKLFHPSCRLDTVGFQNSCQPYVSSFVHDSQQPMDGLDCLYFGNSSLDSETEETVEDSILTDDGGIGSLVCALSSQNPSAQEFASLALMLLAAQGGQDVQTLIGEAGALNPLVKMVDSSTSSLIRESAAAAIAKLVSCHPKNRIRLIRADGIRALVCMAKSSIDKTSSGIRTRAAAVVALLSISEASSHTCRYIIGSLGMLEILSWLANMLESEDFTVLNAAVVSLEVFVHMCFKKYEEYEVFDGRLLWKEELGEQGAALLRCMRPQLEIIAALLEIIKGGSSEAKEAASVVLREMNAGSNTEPSKVTCNSTATEQNVIMLKRKGIEAVVKVLTTHSCGYFELMAAETIAYVAASDKLCSHLEGPVVIPNLMRLLLRDCSPLLTKVACATAVANIGMKSRKLLQLTSHDITILVKLLDDNSCHEQGDQKIPGNVSGFIQQQTDSELSLSHALCENIAAILVYAALSGEMHKQELVNAGGIPIFVGLLNGCTAHKQAWRNPRNGLSCIAVPGVSTLEVEASIPLAAQEYALMALILLADKSSSATQAIVDAGGISIIVKLLMITEESGKLGTSWSEMAAAALLTMANYDAARKELVKVGGMAVLISVLEGDACAGAVPPTGVAAIVQLIGVLALNNADSKWNVSETGLVRCLVEVLTGGGCLQKREHSKSKSPGRSYALAQEAAAAVLANLVRQRPLHGKTAVEAGAIGPLVRMLGSLPAGKVPDNEKGMPKSECGLISGDLQSENGLCSKHAHMTRLLIDSPIESRGSLAAIVALGNLVTCYPVCREEIVHAGGFTRVAALLQVLSSIQTLWTDESDNMAVWQKTQETATNLLTSLVENKPDQT